jgi:selenoprotein W-related protein
LAAEIKKARNLEPSLIKGSGGVFEVVLDGNLIFSKKKLGRFPELSELLDKIPA